MSTIRNADLIVCIDNGEIKETGTHDDLMKLEGLYYDMVTAQVRLLKICKNTQKCRRIYKNILECTNLLYKYDYYFINADSRGN